VAKVVVMATWRSLLVRQLHYPYVVLGVVSTLVHRVFIFLVILVVQEQLAVAQAEVVALRWANEDLA
jgi:hypothetical protein